MSLLQDASFIDVISGLVSHDLPSIQRKAIELLNTKLQQQKEIGEDDVSSISLSSFPYCIEIIRHITLYKATRLKYYSCSTQLSMKFILLINVKMPSIVGILTFLSWIVTTSEKLKHEKSLFFSIFLVTDS